MRKTLSFVLVVLAMPVLAAQTAQQPTGTSGDIDSAIKAVADQYVKATLAGDAKAIASLYTEDAVEMPPNEPPIKGRAAIQQHYEKLFTMGKISGFTLNHLDTQSSGNIGYDVGTYNQRMTPAGGSEMAETGKYTVVLRRSGGEWKIAYAIYNSDSPAMPKK